MTAISIATANGASGTSSGGATPIITISFPGITRPSGDVAILRDEKTQNTAGGTFTSGAWQTRVLQTQPVNVGSHCTLTSNQFVLDAGTYEIFASAPAFQVLAHQARLQNITDTATTIIGTGEYAGGSPNLVNTASLVIGEFTIAAQKTFELQHRCFATVSTNGFGVQSNVTTEVYSTVFLRKVA